MNRYFIFLLLLLNLTFLGCKFAPQKEKIVSSYYPYTFAAKYLGRTDYDYITIYKNIENKNLDTNKISNLKAKLLILNGNNLDDNLKNKIKYEDIFIASSYAKYQKSNYLVFLNPDKMEDVFYGLSQIFCKYNQKKCKYFTKRCGDYVALIEEVKAELLSLSNLLKEKDVIIFTTEPYYNALFDFMKIKPYYLISQNLEKFKNKKYKLVIFPSKNAESKYKNICSKYNLKPIIFDPNIKEDYAKAFIMFSKNIKTALNLGK